MLFMLIIQIGRSSNVFRIRTVNSFNFKYGRVDVEAKMPTGDWLWPAIWMLPK